MKVLVIDAQGGGLGKSLVSQLKTECKDIEIIAVGANTLASEAMRKAGADISATGENAVIVNARKADVIIGPIGIVIADSLNGEITPAMALAVAQSDAKRILIPINKCDNTIVGLADSNLTKLANEAIGFIKNDMVE